MTTVTIVCLAILVIANAFISISFLKRINELERQVNILKRRIGGLKRE